MTSLSEQTSLPDPRLLRTFLAAQVPAPADVIRCDSLLTSKTIVRAGRRVTVLPRFP